jgi:hypothetical protein
MFRRVLGLDSLPGSSCILAPAASTTYDLLTSASLL